VTPDISLGPTTALGSAATPTIVSIPVASWPTTPGTPTTAHPYTAEDTSMIHPPRSTSRALLTGTVLLAAFTLGGCATADSAAPSGADPATADGSSPTPTPVSREEVASWPTIDESGTGPTTITIPNPSPDAFYLNTTFTCSAGEALVEVVENPRVFQGGPCGGSSSYQMPMPTDEDEYTIRIEIDPTATYTFTGRFQPAGATG
jgi:hypothetical protein